MKVFLPQSSKRRFSVLISPSAVDFVCSREKELAKKYYDKLFKEYCIADLSRYKENKVR